MSQQIWSNIKGGNAFRRMCIYNIKYVQITHSGLIRQAGQVYVSLT